MVAINCWACTLLRLRTGQETYMPGRNRDGYRRNLLPGGLTTQHP